MPYTEFACRANIKYLSNVRENWQATVTAWGWKLISLTDFISSCWINTPLWNANFCDFNVYSYIHNFMSIDRQSGNIFCYTVNYNYEDVIT
jgi:hypothetical protein